MTMLEKAAEEANSVLEGMLGVGHNVTPEPLVRAILSAIREPDDAMLAAADKVGIDMDPRDYWPAMVDAILRERPWRVVLGMEGVDRSLIPEFQRPIVEAQYKKLAKERHPGVAGGSYDAFAELTRAVEEAREELR